jgi:hypothetical protein
MNTATELRNTDMIAGIVFTGHESACITPLSTDIMMFTISTTITAVNKPLNIFSDSGSY